MGGGGGGGGGGATATDGALAEGELLEAKNPL
jgi:hypothetical protein